MAIKKLNPKNDQTPKKNVFKTEVSVKEQEEKLFSDSVVQLYKNKTQFNNGNNTRR